MDVKRFVVGTVTGAITVFAGGLLLFSLPWTRDFYLYAMEGGGASSVARDVPLLWAAFLGAVSYAALIALAIGVQPRRPDIAGGVGIGAVVGFLIWATANLMLFAVSNVGTATTALIDPLLELIPGAMAGGLVAAVFRRMGVSTPAHT